LLSLEQFGEHSKDGPQNGVADGQSESIKQPTQLKVLVSQNRQFWLLPVQSTHTPRPADVSHLVGPPVPAPPQSALLTQSRQMPVAVSHKSAPRQSSLLRHPVHVPLARSQ
jgi:hypothetical protein